MTDKYKWGTMTRLPDEHRIFPLADSTHKFAIADNSGLEPQDTDDGVLWLDFDWNLMISSPDEVILVPIKDEQGERHSTITNMSTLLYLSHEFNWPIEDQVSGTLYTIIKREKGKQMPLVGKREINNVEVEIHATQALVRGRSRCRPTRTVSMDAAWLTLPTLEAAINKARQEIKSFRVQVAVPFKTIEGKRGYRHRATCSLARQDPDRDRWQEGSHRLPRSDLQGRHATGRGRSPR